MSKLSILQNYRTELLHREPYYHFAIENALPAQLYKSLEESFPSRSIFDEYSHRKGDPEIRQNTFYKLNADKARRFPQMLSGVWNEFVAYHTSQEFFDEVLDKLGHAIEKTYPELISKMKRKSENGHPRSVVRTADNEKKSSEVVTDCMVGINSPVTVEGTRVIGAHLDNPKMLYAGLLYLRHPEDNSSGGDFVVYEWKDPKNPVYVEKRAIDESQVMARRKIEYRANSFVWFLNAFAAVHGVTVREKTQFPRRLCEILADADPTQPRLFELTGKPFRNSFLESFKGLFQK